MSKKEALTLKEVARMTNSVLVGDENHRVDDVSDLVQGGSSDLSFLANPRYMKEMIKSRAGAIFISPQVEQLSGKNYLVNEYPSKAFQQLVDYFHPPRDIPSGFRGIHPTAVVHPTAKVAEDAIIGPHAVLDEESVVGSKTYIGAGSYIGSGTVVGKNCLIYPRVVIREDCIIGDRVVIQPGAVIGSCGYGYFTSKEGIHTKLNQVGNVELEDDVEIGANTTIDRSRFKSTIVRKGSKIDNLVQLGHGVEVGEHNLIVAQSGIAGSTTTGNCVTLAGQVAVAGHLHLDDGVVVGGKSGVTKSLKKGVYAGFPAIPHQEHNRLQVTIRQLPKYLKRIREFLKDKENDL